MVIVFTSGLINMLTSVLISELASRLTGGDTYHSGITTSQRNRHNAIGNFPVGKQFFSIELALNFKL